MTLSFMPTLLKLAELLDLGLIDEDEYAVAYIELAHGENDAPATRLLMRAVA